jgi:hypothetical protein
LLESVHAAAQPQGRYDTFEKRIGQRDIQEPIEDAKLRAQSQNESDAPADEREVESPGAVL